MTVHLHAGPDDVVIDPRDGRITSFVADGTERLVTGPPDTEAAPFLWGCFVMAPWAGRIRHGRFPWQGDEAELDRRMHGHAIHGLVMDQPWEVVSATDDAVALRVRLDDAPWPYAGTVVTHALRLSPGRLDLELAVQAGDEPIPVTVGWHPCFARPATGDVTVTVRADHVLATDDDNVPSGDLVAVDDRTDLRAGTPLGDRRLDTTYVDVAEPVEIIWPDLTLRMDHHGLGTFVVFTPDFEFCVEPQSGWPDAVNLAALDPVAEPDPTGLQTVDPNTRRHWHTTWRWTSLPRR